MNSSSRASGIALAFSLLFSTTHNSQAQTWTQTGAPSNYWAGIACSADGMALAAITGGQFYVGQIYSSTNAGTNWTLTSAPSLHWTSVASSADGARLAAVAYGNGIYTSTNAGENWVSNSVAAGNWTSIASSAHGSKLAAVKYASLVYRSTDSGATWTSNSVPFIADFLSVAVSSDGSTFVAGNNVGRLVVSTNSGLTWGRSNSLGATVTCLNSSVNGQRLTGMASGLGVFTSADGGVSWHSNSVPSNSSWSASASSADGTQVTALGQKSIIYSTTNSGATWISNSAPNLLWSGVASSADGSVVYATPINGAIWTRRSVPVPVVHAAHSNNDLVISWVVPSARFVLESTTDVTVSNWLEVIDQPSLNASTLEYQIAPPLTNASAFYRLKML